MVLESVKGVVEYAKASSKGTGWNYKLGGKWFFAEKKIPPVKDGDNVLIEYTVEGSPEKPLNIIHNIKDCKEVKVVEKDFKLCPFWGGACCNNIDCMFWVDGGCVILKKCLG